MHGRVAAVKVGDELAKPAVDVFEVSRFDGSNHLVVESPVGRRIDRGQRGRVVAARRDGRESERGGGLLASVKNLVAGTAAGSRQVNVSCRVPVLQGRERGDLGDVRRRGVGNRRSGRARCGVGGDRVGGPRDAGKREDFATGGPP